MFRSLARQVFALVCLLTITSPAYAQGGSGTTSLSGTVTDAAGGVVPGATVVVKNNANSTTFEVVTNTAGAFSVPALDPGTYSVTVSLSGFKTTVVNNVRLLAASPGNLKAVLEVGNLSETVEVRGGSELVQTQSTTVSSTINAEQIANLPMPTHNALHFVPFLAGVDTVTNVRDSTINGLPESTINITIDGVNVNNNMQKNTDGFYSMIRPNLDAIEAVTVTGATPGAESAGQGAVQVRFVTRSGTNKFNGSFYEYFRHPRLNTNYYFNEVNGLAKNNIILNQFGGRVGGPIVIPKLYDGRGKAFFFFNYEEFRQPTEATRTRTVLHPRAQDGIFRYTIPGTGQVREVNLLALAASNNQLTSTDATVMGVLNRIRAATATTGTITDNTNPLLQNYVYLSPGDFLEHLPTTRLDFNLSDNHRLSGTYIWQQVDRTPDIQNSDDPQFPGFANVGNYYSYRTTGSATLRSTFTSSLVNEFLVGWQWAPGNFSSNVNPSQFEDQGGFTFPFVLGLSSPTTQNGPSARNTVNWNIDNTMNLLRGTHSYSFGASYTQIRHWETNASAVQEVNFGVDTTNDPANAMFTTANFTGASNANLNDARALYALLTGRVTSINGTARLDESTNQYVYLGGRNQRVLMNSIGVFAQDSWRYRPTLTVNYGLRWELQLPFSPANSTYSSAGMSDVCGVSGTGNGPGGRPCNLFSPNTLTGSRPQYVQYDSGDPGYGTDWNNVAPNVGVAWRPNAQGGFLKGLLGDPEQAVLRAGYSMAYNRAGVQEFTGVYGNNPGSTVGANRNVGNGNLVGPGETWPLLLRDRSRLGPPATCAGTISAACIPVSPVYPTLATTANSLNVFEPSTEVPYTHSWSVGLQRALSKDMAVEVRYVGTRNRKGWTTENWNETNVIENGFLDEFRLAQQNLRAHVAAGCGTTGNPACSFAYRGPGTGTAPLPTYLAYLAGQPASQAGNAALYTSTQFTNTTRLGNLAYYEPSLYGEAGFLFSTAAQRDNALRAGLAPNFFILNPDVSNANVTTSASRTQYDALQIEFRRRMSQGLTLQANYTYAVKNTSALDTLRRERTMVQMTFNNSQQPRVPHAFKLNWVYEVPVGRGKRFGTDMNPVLNAILGNWNFDGTGRVQTGRLLTLTGVRLVGMTEKELQAAYKIRIETDPSTGRPIVYTLPQDIIDNTIRAFSSDPTSPTGYSTALGAPTGRYIGPASYGDCLEVVVGDCAPRNVYVRGPIISRFDLSLKKRFPFGTRSFDLQFDVLNAFNAINFIPVFEAGSAADINQVETAYTDISQTFDPGGRLGQIVFRFNW